MCVCISLVCAWVLHCRSLTLPRAMAMGSFVESCKPRHALEVGGFLGLSANYYLRLAAPWGGLVPHIRNRIKASAVTTRARPMCIPACWPHMDMDMALIAGPDPVYGSSRRSIPT